MLDRKRNVVYRNLQNGTYSYRTTALTIYLFCCASSVIVIGVIFGLVKAFWIPQSSVSISCESNSTLWIFFKDERHEFIWVVFKSTLFVILVFQSVWLEILNRRHLFSEITVKQLIETNGACQDLANIAKDRTNGHPDIPILPFC